MKIMELFEEEFSIKDARQKEGVIEKMIFDKLGYKAGVSLRRLHVIYVQLSKPKDARDHETIGQVMVPWLRDNLPAILPGVKVTLGRTVFSPSKRSAELEFKLSWEWYSL